MTLPAIFKIYIAANLFIKMMAKYFSQAKPLQARIFHGLVLHTEVIGPIRRDISGHLSMVTRFGFKRRDQRSNSIFGKDSQTMTSYKLISHSKP